MHPKATSTMRVIKRDGSSEPVSFDKVLRRIQRLCDKDHERGLCDLPMVDAVGIAQSVITRLFDGVTTAQLDEYTASLSASMITDHPDYGSLASRVSVSNLHKNTPDTLADCVRRMRYFNYDSTGGISPLVSDEVEHIVTENEYRLQTAIDYNLDYDFDTFGLATLMRGYLQKTTGVCGKQTIVERPQHMIMRVAIGIHGHDIDSVIKTYEMMSRREFTHASPTLYNAGTNHPQMSSCFLLTVKDDSIDGIYKTIRDCARISKFAGGIGVAVSNVRAAGSLIRGTNGKATGLVPMLRNFNATARYVNQGGKRLGSFAMYLEPWHADIFQFIELRKNHGDEEQRTRDLFLALWVPDLFMRRVMSGGSWSLFCPDECRGLRDVYGEEFDALYESFEKSGAARRTVPAMELWQQIIRCQIETGTPYVCFKDACNSKSNQSNLGTIKSSNLCAEIVEYTDSKEHAVCNLASICLPRFVKSDGSYDYEALRAVAYQAVRNLDRVIDRNFYPVKQARASNLRHRPIGVGVQGLADAFAKMRLPFDSLGAERVNKNIFETIYYGCVEASVDLASTEGAYETYAGSPASRGLLQFDMWGVIPDSGLWDWDALKRRMAEHGLRNSLLVALMPTASTSQIMGNAESFEPFSGLIFTRKTLAGDIKLVNKYLVQDLIREGLWSKDMKDRIIAAGDSIQGMLDIPESIRALYKTVWEVKQRVLINMQADRGPYVCQSASNNLYVSEPRVDRISNMVVYAWSKGLKTGLYYLRVTAKMEAQQFTVDPRVAEAERKNRTEAEARIACSRANPEACEMCSA